MSGEWRVLLTKQKQLQFPTTCICTLYFNKPIVSVSVSWEHPLKLRIRLGFRLSLRLRLGLRFRLSLRLRLRFSEGGCSQET